MSRVLTIEVLVVETEGVNVATVFVTNTVVTFVPITALGTFATVGSLNRARVGSVRIGDLVGFP